MTREEASRSILRRPLDLLFVLAGALALTLAFFLVLPLIQAIGRPSSSDLVVRRVDAAVLPPPPPPPEEPPEDDTEEEEDPPELVEEVQPLDLSQLQLALNPGIGDGWLGGDFTVDLGGLASGEEAVDALFSVADLDQKPRAIYQPSPILDAKLRRKAPGTVRVVFEVDQSGRVQDPKVLKSSDPVFERPALAAVKQWKFEPGRRNGEPVRFRMLVPITFSEG